MRQVVFFLCVLAFFCGCTNIDKYMDSETRQSTNDSIQGIDRMAVWYVYTDSINGFDVSAEVHIDTNCVESNCCSLAVNLSKGDLRYLAKMPGSYDSFFHNTNFNDTIFVKPMRVDTINGLFLNFNTIVSFGDVNYDGEEELIVCGCPHTNRESDNVLDCEFFTIYKITTDSLVQLHNLLFDKLADGECRTKYIFDKERQTITLVGFHNAYDTSVETYWFKDGELFQLDYKYTYSYRGNDPNQCDSIIYLFKLPSDETKYKQLMDSVSL